MASGSHGRGLMLALVGVLVISPDALVLRLAPLDGWTLLVWRNLLYGGVMALGVVVASPADAVSRLLWIGRYGVMAAAALSVSNISFLFAVLGTATADVLIVISATPLFAALLGRLVFGERLALRTWLAMVLVMLGIAVTALGSRDTGGQHSLLGLGLALLAASAFALFLNLIRHAPGVSAAASVAWSCLIASAVGVLVGAPTLPGLEAWPYLAALGLVMYPLSMLCTTMAVRLLPGAEVSLVLLLEAVLGPLCVWAVLNEAPTPHAFVGGGLVLGTLAIHSLLAARAAPPPDKRKLPEVAGEPY